MGFTKENTIGAKNKNWKGDKVKYLALHTWVKRNFPPKGKCEMCQKRKDKLHTSNKTGVYNRDPKNWWYLCPSCHALYDEIGSRQGDLIKLRPDLDTYFLKLALLVKERSTCRKLAVGSVLVKEKRIISTGYVGSIPGTPHCLDAGCDIVDGHCVRTIHSESNAWIQSVRFGATSTLGATLYCTHSPCLKCFKELVGCGIARIVFARYYRDDYGIDKRAAELGIETTFHPTVLLKTKDARRVANLR